VQLTTEAPSAWDGQQASSNGFDLLVFDGFVPPELPATTPYLVVGPPADRQLGSGAPVAPGPLVPAEADDPLLYDVDLSNVDVAMSADLAGSNFGRVAISSRAGPVLMVRAGSQQGPPAAVLGLYLHESDIVLRSAFPILVTHLSEYLAPGPVPSGSQVPGSPVTLSPGPGTSEVVVTRPDGRTYTVRAQAIADAGGMITFTGTDEAGLYQVTSLGPGKARHRDYLAVNSPGTPIAPRRALPVEGSVTKGQLRSVLYEDLWPWAAFAGLLVLMVEWLESHRAR
jgi:hypothetical protein